MRLNVEMAFQPITTGREQLNLHDDPQAGLLRDVLERFPTFDDLSGVTTRRDPRSKAHFLAEFLRNTIDFHDGLSSVMSRETLSTSREDVSTSSPQSPLSQNASAFEQSLRQFSLVYFNTVLNGNAARLADVLLTTGEVVGFYQLLSADDQRRGRNRELRFSISSNGNTSTPDYASVDSLNHDTPVEQVSYDATSHTLQFAISK